MLRWPAVSVGFAKARDPRKIPEHSLWTLHKNGRTAEARTRMVPAGPELRIYVTSRQTMEPTDLLWSQVMRDGRAIGDLADEKKREFEARGWAAR